MVSRYEQSHLETSSESVSDLKLYSNIDLLVFPVHVGNEAPFDGIPIGTAVLIAVDSWQILPSHRLPSLSSYI
jgi:hypothetical protein